MLVVGFAAGRFATNCYVVATGPGAECLVIDPGENAAPSVEQAVREHRLKPVAVLVTHGHVDHMWSVAPVCGSHEATCWVHPGDREMLSDPMRGTPPDLAELMLGGSYKFAEPDDVRELGNGSTLDVAGVCLRVTHTPGHTPGSVTFRWAPGDTADDPELLFAGDLLFAGSIGRTDLPGGDHATMMRSLTEHVLRLDDRIVVLPGHGPRTTIGDERATNPFLRDLVRFGASA